MCQFGKLADEAVKNPEPKKLRAIRHSKPYPGRMSQSFVQTISIGVGLPDVDEMCAELDEYRDILLGRREAPVSGVLALMETASAYFARASEMDQLILRLERESVIAPSHVLSRFRKGELRSFRELCSKAADLGSRRLTAASLEFEQQKLGRDIVG